MQDCRELEIDKRRRRTDKARSIGKHLGFLGFWILYMAVCGRILVYAFTGS